LVYPIEDNIPIMLVDQAKPLQIDHTPS
jgi:uncharacterized protein YbaR (Trm112 family)